MFHMPEHHPEEGLLLDYASGSAGEAVGLIVATHLTFCPQCRATVGELEKLGTSLVGDLPAGMMSEAALDRLLSRLDEPEAAMPLPIRSGLPAPLSGYLGGGLEQLSWRRVARGIEQHVLPTAPGAARAMLLKVAPGRHLPRHTHRGNELTLVLQGDYADHLGAFGPGDFEAADPTLTHHPLIGKDQPCVSLLVLDAPLRLVGALGRLIDPFVQL